MNYSLHHHLDLLRSVQAHGASPEQGWGYCYLKALIALHRLQGCEPETGLPGFPDEDFTFWDDVRYCEGWMVVFRPAPEDDQPAPPHWVTHGFLIAGDGQIIDPMTGKAALERGEAAVSTRAWIPVFTYALNDLPAEMGTVFWGGAELEGDDDDLPAELIAAREQHEQWALDRAAHLHQLFLELTR